MQQLSRWGIKYYAKQLRQNIKQTKLNEYIHKILEQKKPILAIKL